MKTRIVHRGKAQGVRIPKALLEQTGLKGEVEITAVGESLVIRSVNVKGPRQGWAAAFREMARCGDDDLLDAGTTKWDEEEWEWRY